MGNIYSKLKEVGVRLNHNGHICKEDIDRAEPFLLEYVAALPKDSKFDIQNPAMNFKTYIDIVQDREIFSKKLGEYLLVKYPSSVALIEPHSKHVSYLVRFKKINFLEKNAVTEVILWREQPNQFVADLRIDDFKLTAYALFKLLLTDNDCIITDNSPVEMGKRFWCDRIADAWNAGCPVYYIDMKINERTIVTSDNFQSLKIYDNLWGRDSDYMHRKLAICRESLTEWFKK